MRPKIYIETSIISYLAAWPSRDLITAAHQQITHSWWHERSTGFELLVSQLVLDEASAGDPDAAERRMGFIRELPVVDIDDAVAELAESLIKEIPLPRKAGADAAHIAAAACHGLDFLLTWNCAHIANAQLRPQIETICRAHGYSPPVLCTPDELMGEDNEEDHDEDEWDG